jgi:hypothetical protein
LGLQGQNESVAHALPTKGAGIAHDLAVAVREVVGITPLQPS